MYYYFVMAKVDQGDAPFDAGLVQSKYPGNYELVPGHVWVVGSDSPSSFDVAAALGLVAGGTSEVSGVVVPAKGYWGFAPKRLWNVLQPDGYVGEADRKGLQHIAMRQQQ